MAYIKDRDTIWHAWLTNFLLNRVMSQGGSLDEAVEALILTAGEGEDHEFETSERYNEAAILAARILEDRASGRPDAIVFGRPERKVRTEVELGDVEIGDVLDGRLVVGTGHRARPGHYTRLAFETPGVHVNELPDSAWTEWLDSDQKVAVYVGV